MPEDRREKLRKKQLVQMKELAKKSNLKENEIKGIEEYFVNGDKEYETVIKTLYIEELARKAGLKDFEIDGLKKYTFFQDKIDLNNSELKELEKYTFFEEFKKSLETYYKDRAPKNGKSDIKVSDKTIRKAIKNAVLDNQILVGFPEDKPKELDEKKGEVELQSHTINITRRKNFSEFYDMWDNYIDYNEVASKLRKSKKGIIYMDNYECYCSDRIPGIKTKIGEAWLVNSYLDVFLKTKRPDMDFAYQIKQDDLNISRSNNFILPQIAKQMNLNTVVFYRARETIDGKEQDYYLAKGLMNPQENLILGDAIAGNNSKKTRIDSNNILEKTHDYIKKSYSKEKLKYNYKADYENIRKDLIKQFVFDKIVSNNNEANSKWGLVEVEQKRLKVAPIFSFDYSAEVSYKQKNYIRTIGRNGSLEKFIKEYSKEKWFSDWIKEDVLKNVDLEKARETMIDETGRDITDEEFDRYEYIINRNLEKVRLTLEKVEHKNDNSIFNKIKNSIFKKENNLVLNHSEINSNSVVDKSETENYMDKYKVANVKVPVESVNKNVSKNDKPQDRSKESDGR